MTTRLLYRSEGLSTYLYAPGRCLEYHFLNLRKERGAYGLKVAMRPPRWYRYYSCNMRKLDDHCRRSYNSLVRSRKVRVLYEKKKDTILIRLRRYVPQLHRFGLVHQIRVAMGSW